MSVLHPFFRRICTSRARPECDLHLLVARAWISTATKHQTPQATAGIDLLRTRQTTKHLATQLAHRSRRFFQKVPSVLIPTSGCCPTSLQVAKQLLPND